MFLKNSRYYDLPTVIAQDRSGDAVTAVKLRRLPAVTGDPFTVQGHDRLDRSEERRVGKECRL